MKNILKISIYILTSFCVFVSCNSDNQSDEIQEDYEKLFPWQGIDKPENAYEDMNIKSCNTEQMLENYRDLSKEIEEKRVYIVTFECSFNETFSGSRYEFRYVDENKKIKAIGTKSTQKDISYVLKNGEIFKKTFKVKSGYPMYLFVNGGGNMNSSVKAKITAKSEDGLIVVPVLSVQQYQNKRGYNPLQTPYCEYIILP
ncbi:MAG: hypothetical protein KGV44_03365 [Flavobacteriaceae bacterium]|nr:hypothetical protein [Flavobacteriaceae bacterium]